MPDKITSIPLEKETRFTLRINTEILNKIKSRTITSKRSTAKEIEYILEQWLNENTD